MKTVDYQIPKENMSDLYKNIFQITAAFEKQIVIPKNPNLTIRLCNIGFNIVGFDLDFSYRDPDEKEIQNMKDIYDIRNFNSMKIIKDLVNMEFITTKQSTGEIHISLNSKKQQEIYDFVKGEE